VSDTITGIQGGKYKPYIESLVELEEAKRKPLDERLEKSQDQRRIWLDTNRSMNDVRAALSRLQGFESVFGDRIVNSGDENAMVAAARRNVKPVDIEADVEQRAEADRFFSKELETNFQVGAGTYTFMVGEKELSLNYGGGSLQNFADAVSNLDPSLLKASIIQTSPGRDTFFLESQVTGKVNKLDFKDAARPFAFDIGLITDKIESKYRVASDTQGLRPGSDIDLMRPLRLGQGRQLNVAVTGDAPLDLREGAYLSFDYKTRGRPTALARYPETQENAAQAVREGHLAKEGDGGAYILPEIGGEVNIYAQIDNEVVPLISLMPSQESRSVKLDLGNLKGEVQNIILSNNNTAAEIETEKMVLFVPGDVDFVPVNPASRAQDAEFTLDGVKISRPVNEIEGLMPGVDFTVKGKSEKPFTISIRNNIDSAMEAIQNFVWSYDQLIAKVNIVTAPADQEEIVDELGYLSDDERKQALEDLGLFMGDQTFVGIKNRMHTMMINTQTVKIGIDPQQMQIREMGIGTNLNIGQASTASQRRGYFEVNSSELKTALENRWDDIRDFFSSNTTGRGIADQGLAVDMTKYIDSYVGNTGIIRSRTATLDSTITRQQRDIDDFNKKLEEKKQRWEEDFSRAESAENQMRRSTQQMNNMFGNNNNNR
jgi:flagellar hook-associated protein 2